MKRLAFLSMVATAGVFWAAMVACSSDGSSTFNENGTDSSFDGAVGFADGGLEDAGPVTCTTALPTTFAPKYLAPGTPAGQCTSDELGAYFDACLGGGGSPEGCATWRTTHDACTACIEPDGGTGPVQTYVDHKYSQLNLGGCVAIEQGVPADGNTCAAALQASDQCQVASCLPCIQKEGVTNDTISACKTQAKGAGCAPYASGISSACPTGYAGPDGGAYDCFPHGNEQAADPRTWLVRVLGVYCGPAH